MTDASVADFQAVIDKLDVSNTIGSIEQLGDQIQHVWELAKSVSFDSSYADINKVIVAGMGGSALGTHVIQTVYKDELTVPVIIASDYTVPNYVDEHTLVIGSSYSGNTEETLSAVYDAHKKGAKIAGISAGGKLAEFLKTNNFPALIFEPKYNPSNSPRMALGYSVFGQIALFSRLGLLKVSESDYQQVLDTIANVHLRTSRHIEKSQNQAMLLAFNLIDRIPVFTIAEHLEGAAHVVANQTNENAKTYSEYRVVPEINHHLMEGLQFPKKTEDTLYFVTVHSELYMDHNKKRMDLTEQVLDQNHIEYLSIHLKGQTKLAQAFELLLLGSYTGFYLSMMHDIDPTPIPWVDWFKDQLAKA
jgi:glucose/mannose-6-phosphate isomerase